MATNGSGDDVEQQEWIHFNSVLRTFQNYKLESLERVYRSEQYLNQLPEYHQEWLQSYRSDLQIIKRCIEHNSSIIDIMTKEAPSMFENVRAVDANISSASYGTVGEVLAEGVDKVQATLKQLARDWSSMGAVERSQCYQPIIEEIERKFLNNAIDPSQIKILVPGSGLGRLTYEIASRGFVCQGNEYNLFMLIVSFFVLNRCTELNSFTIYPWVQQHVNNLSVKHQTAAVTFPDISPNSISGKSSGFSMAAGDFLEVYKEEQVWDCVATCFFIDCAHNIVAFIETIYKILKHGGYWINLGPLLYHYSGAQSQPSIEPSFEAVKKAISCVGFIMEKCDTRVKSRYCQNPASMLQYEYDSVFFVCRKL
ncbi:carnosine N-methyltransferase [Chrysoperla carnea]|uniref:carnosine N-methyltransferase n=1 Tax=Chrysoperla carnea TaxID=189513 RepID=UPI001D05DCAA|nr:carnosine N-methyltransferase [Chrysoperla carnea]